MLTDRMDRTPNHLTLAATTPNPTQNRTQFGWYWFIDLRLRLTSGLWIHTQFVGNLEWLKGRFMDEPMHVFSPSNCCPNRPPAWWFLPLCLPSLPLWFVVHRRGGGREKPPLSAVGATWVRSYGSFSRRRHIRPAVAPGGRSPVRERER